MNPAFRIFRNLCLVLALYFIAAPLQAASPPTQTAEAGTWQARLEAFGQVGALAESRIQLPFSLRVTEAPVVPGRAVAAGEVLLRFEAPALHQALAAYADARRTARVATQRLKVLRANVKQHTATRREVLAAEQDRSAARAVVNAAWDRLYGDLAVLDNRLRREELDRRLDAKDETALNELLAVLHAPFAGVLNNRPPAVGAWVPQATPLLELEDLSRVYVRVGVPGNALDRWRDGQASVAVDGATIPLTPLPGAPGIDAASGLRLLRFRASNPDALLQDGQWVRVTHRGAAKAVVWVTEAAVVSRNGRAWCLVRDGEAIKPVAVEVGTAEAGRVPVLAGLQAGQNVVTQGAYELLYRDLKDLIRFVD